MSRGPQACLRRGGEGMAPPHFSSDRRLVRFLRRSLLIGPPLTPFGDGVFPLLIGLAKQSLKHVRFRRLQPGVHVAIIGRSLSGKLQHHDQCHVANLDPRGRLTRPFRLKWIANRCVGEQRLQTIYMFAAAQLTDDQYGQRPRIRVHALCAENRRRSRLKPAATLLQYQGSK